MNPTLGLSLGLALLSLGCGITLPNSVSPEDPQPLIRIPDNLGPDQARVDVPQLPGTPSTAPEPEVPTVERPYMAPPLIADINPVPTPAPEEAPLPQLPTPEQAPQPIPAIVQTVTFKEDGLAYAPEADTPFSGLAQETDATGRIVYEGEFQSGRREGEGVLRDASGRTHREGLWKQGRLFTGTVYFYYAGTDQISLKGEYLKGRLIEGHNYDRAGRIY